MSNDRSLVVLHDLLQTMVAESGVQPLIANTLQRLMFHTSSPCGLFFSYDDRLSVDSFHACLERVIGDRALVSDMGKMLVVSSALVTGGSHFLDTPKLWKGLHGNLLRYPYALVLDVPAGGFFILFFSVLPENTVPLEHMFEPVLKSFGRMLNLCRVNETYTAQLLEDRDMAYGQLTRFKAALDSTDDSVFLIDPITMCFVDCNRAALVGLGYSRDELMTMGPHDIKPDYDIEVLRTLFRRLLESNRPSLEIQTRYRRKDGSTFLVEVRFSILRQAHQSPLAIAVVRDISERVKIETELQEHRQKLEEIVTQRTEELTVANAELESFSYSVSHDLRAPLRSIAGFSQILIEDYSDNLDEEGRDYLSRVRDSCRRMDVLIDDLLGLSRMTRAELRRVAVDLSAIAVRVAGGLSEQWPERQVEWQIMDGLSANADPQLMIVVLENMLGNAFKYTARQAQAEIEFSCRKDKGKTVYFVRDNGAGFDMRFVKKVFTPFERLHTWDEFPGTGIGLATVERIIHRHGGRVWAESTLDKGAVFSFTLD